MKYAIARNRIFLIEKSAIGILFTTKIVPFLVALGTIAIPDNK
jgi:hypothetical protein